MANVRVCADLVGRKGERLERRMEVSDAVLREEADEVEAPDRIFPFRWGKDRTEVIIEGLKLREVSVEGGNILCTNACYCTDLKDVTSYDQVVQFGS